jgi:hypothetical protein
MMVITPKHVGAVLNVNFNTPFKKNLSINWCKNFNIIKMHGTTVKIMTKSVAPTDIQTLKRPAHSKLLY